ncbi:MAG TPA: hypothetical protein VF432_13420 [Thermoanaerobaculia bacterium]
MATRRIIRSEEFVEASRGLACAETERMVEQLAELLAARPHWAPAIAGSTLRILHTGPYGKFPALRLCYRFDEETLHLLLVEVYDPLRPER